MRLRGPLPFQLPPLFEGAFFFEFLLTFCEQVGNVTLAVGQFIFAPAVFDFASRKQVFNTGFLIELPSIFIELSIGLALLALRVCVLQ